ncbi:MAG TPA: hypothetical protein VD867_17745 [Burkholderiales bacterium]|nr:hypothetical protein [Burkholderiales bacterium]
MTSRGFGNGFEGRGTRFRLYPQSPILTSVPGSEVVWVSRPPGSIAPGPSDDRMYVVDAVDKARPYDYPYLPPYEGARNPPVRPDAQGHFDYLTDSWSRDFMAAHMYGTLRFVLDVWEKYFGGPIPWHFQEYQARLELIPIVDWDNAHSGFGFIETGYARPQELDPQPFCLNFDVLAHEMGHSFIYKLLGTPPVGHASAEYLAFHESAADCVAMIAAMHFDSVVDRLLVRSSGNIYLPNELNRIGELSENNEIRLASQSVRLSDVPDLRTPAAQLSQPQRHAMSLPLTGAVFDMFIDVFQTLLVQDGLISPALDALARPGISAWDEAEVQRGFDRAYQGHHEQFKAVIADARDYVGRCLAVAWRTLSWDVSYSEVGAALLAADRRLAGGAGRDIMSESMAWRGIQMPVVAGRVGDIRRRRAQRATR